MTTNGGGVTTNYTLAKQRPAMDRFLDRLRQSGNVRLSCQAAGINRKTAYNWRNKWSTFAAEWDDALQDALDILEGKAWERAAQQSDRLLMFLLKAHRRDVYGDKAELDVTSGGEPIRVIGGINLDDV
jgi:hypothetical protein